MQLRSSLGHGRVSSWQSRVWSLPSPASLRTPCSRVAAPALSPATSHTQRRAAEQQRASTAADETEAAESTELAGSPCTITEWQQTPDGCVSTAAHSGKPTGTCSSGGGRGRAAGRGQGRGASTADRAPPTAATGTAAQGRRTDRRNAAATAAPQGPGNSRPHSAKPTGRAAAREGRSSTPSRLSSDGRETGGWDRSRGRSVPPVGGTAKQGHLSPSSTPPLGTLLKNSADAHSLMQLVEHHEGSSALNHITAAAALTRFAKLAQEQRLPKEQGRVWVARLIGIAKRHIAAAEARQLVNMLHAVATLQSKTQLGPVDPAFAQQLLTALQGRVPENGQGLSNTLWALAILCGDQHSHSDFIQAWVKEAAGRLSDFNAQNLANSLWALATLCGDQHSHSHFIQAWVKEAAGRLSDFNAQNLANSLWALATLCGDQRNHSSFIQAWVRQAEGRLSGFNPQNLSNSLWALAKLGHTDGNFTARLLQAARAQLHGFKPQELSNTALALATLRYQDPDFMQQLIHHARSKLPDFTSQAMANTLLAMAWLDYNDAAFVDDVVRHMLQHRDRFNRQELCNTLWALCILDHSPTAVLQPLLAEASSALLLPDTVDDHSDEQPDLFKSQCQAYQYLVTIEAQGHISHQLKAQHRRLWEVCRAAWAVRLQQGARASFTQQQVLQAVRELPGCEGATCEQLTEDGLLSVDVALQLPDGKKVAVEVDGPMHFMCNAPDVPDGSTLWRNRMLQLRGWNVVSVPVVQWSRLGSNAEKQRAYLQQRFAQAGVQLPGASSAAADMQQPGAVNGPFAGSQRLQAKDPDCVPRACVQEGLALGQGLAVAAERLATQGLEPGKGSSEGLANKGRLRAPHLSASGRSAPEQPEQVAAGIPSAAVQGSGKQRRCSKCGQRGHNARTCGQQ